MPGMDRIEDLRQASSPPVEIRLLGPVEICGGPVRRSQPRERTVLAALAADADRFVAWDVLVERVWGERPPDGVRPAVYAYIARLRAGGVAIDRGRGGYRLRVDPARVDLHRFRQLRADARDASPGRRRALLGEAIALWHGDALAGIDGPWANRTRECWH
jgi:DNA-binding SARP family transcriptional activator